MNFTPKHILWIHGYTGNIENNDFWKSMIEYFEKQNISLLAPQFSESRITKFSEWEEILNSQDLSQIDTIVWHSLWTRVATEYIIKNNLKLDRLILIAPTITLDETDWTKTPELLHFFDDYKIWELDSRFNKLKELVKEIIIISSIDDTAVPFTESKQFAEIIGAKFIEVDWYNHFNAKQYDVLEKLVQFGDIN